MNDHRTDAIAYEAARLLETGKAPGLVAAIAAAADTLGFGDAPLPSSALVRRHIQGMSMQAMGAEAYEDSIHQVLHIAEDMMSALEHEVGEGSTLLAGRAARGYIDGGVTLHIRIYTELPIEKIAELLEQYDYEDPAYETAETRNGRLGRLRFIEDGQEILITRCLPEMRATATNDLFTGKTIQLASVEDLRKRLTEQ